jgi:hypothetical protein
MISNWVMVSIQTDLHSRVPSSKSVSDRYISRHSKVSRIQDLVGAGVGKNGLGVDTSLVSESTETGDVVVAAQRHKEQ